MHLGYSPSQHRFEEASFWVNVSNVTRSDELVGQDLFHEAILLLSSVSKTELIESLTALDQFKLGKLHQQYLCNYLTHTVCGIWHSVRK